jgi:hypothetical protein
LAGFAERQFINFTYFGAFFILNYTLLAFFYKKTEKFPKLSLAMPLVMLSKPIILSIMPILFLSVLIAKNSKLRIVLFISFLAGLFQFYTLLNSYLGGVFIPSSAFTTIEKIISGVMYSVFYLEGAVFGKVAQHYIFSLNYARLFFYSPFLFLVYKYRKNLLLLILESKQLLLLLLSTALACSIFNSFAVSDYWNLDIYNQFNSIDVNRYSFFLIGIFFYVIAAILNGVSRDRKIQAHVYFMIWVIITGWAFYFVYKDISKNGNGKFPLTDSSYWQEAHANGLINKTCVPVNPLGWVYGNKCSNIERIVYSANAYSFIDIRNISWEKTGKYLSSDNLLSGYGLVMRRNLNGNFKIESTLRSIDNKDIKLSRIVQEEENTPLLVYFWLEKPVDFKSVVDISIKIPKGIEVAVFSKNEKESSFMVNGISPE